MTPEEQIATLAEKKR